MKHLLLCLLLCSPFAFIAQINHYDSKLYHDGHGGFVYFPLGSISFADELISFKEGDPAAKETDYRNPKEVIGEPDYDMETEKKALSLGCGGELIVRFSNNALTDQSGPDLYIFETGSAIEPTSLSISKDGISWTEIGEISGGRADIDLAGKVKPEDIFYYVKLTDLRSGCGGDWPGSDIDAIGAIGSVIRLTLNNSVLFDFGKSTLKPEATAEIKNIVNSVEGFKKYSVEIEGHTDSIGSNEANIKLSLDRANSVKDQFVKENISADVITTNGYGETVPLVSNNSEENRKKNRRVNIVIKPISADRKAYDVEKNTLVMSYLKNIDKCKNGFPKPINELFPGVWTEGIDEVLALNGLIYFFKGADCIAFNKNTGKAGAPQKITDIFPGIWETGFDAVVNWGNGKLYFFKEREYIRFDLKNNSLDAGYPAPTKGNWGLPWFDNGVDAAINWGDGYVYFFKNDQYVKYEIASDSPVKDYPLSVSLWGSLWADKIDAAFEFNSNEIYFIRNPQKKK